MKKTSIRNLVLAGAVALATVGAPIPAHATISGSNPRPCASKAEIIVSAILTVLGY
jgi:hypothetical protein